MNLRREAGFTLVELLLVMLVIGLLAAIAVPSFLLQKDKAYDAEGKNAARNAAEAIEVYATDNHGEYSNATPARLISIEQTLTGASLSVSSAANSYTVTVVVPETANSFWIERKPNGQSEAACSVAGSSGCPVSGRWDG